MGSFVASARRWLGGSGPPAAPTPFEVACPCGHVLRGLRQPAHQVIPCLACARPVFILPRSPLPPVADLRRPPGPRAERVPKRAGPRLAAALAGLVLLGSVLALAVLLNFPSDATAPTPDRRAILARLEQGRDALSRGKFALARQELAEVRRLVQQSPEALSAAERRGLAQLDRQAGLLADLASDSLEDILRQAVELHDVDDREWRHNFQSRYHGKGVVFGTEVQRVAGSYAVRYQVFALRRPARVEWGELRLLSALPLDQPRRLLFGARLADVRVEAGGRWAVRFAPDSGVLITDAGAATALRLGLEPDAALLAVLHQQEEWLAQLP